MLGTRFLPPVRTYTEPVIDCFYGQLRGYYSIKFSCTCEAATNVINQKLLNVDGYKSAKLACRYYRISPPPHPPPPNHPPHKNTINVLLHFIFVLVHVHLNTEHERFDFSDFFSLSATLSIENFLLAAYEALDISPLSMSSPEKKVVSAR